MIRIIKYLIYSGLFFGSLLSFSQESTVVNTGDMYVSEGTEVVCPHKVENKDGATLLNDGETHFRADIKNDGSFGFKKKGYIVLDGENTQKIDGTKNIEAFDILFNNPTSNKAFELDNKLNVSGTANFHDGIIHVSEVDESALIFEKGSKIKNVSDDSHVDGLVHKKGNEEFYFPVGNKNYYRYAKISAPKKIVDEFSSKYYFKDSNDNMPHNQKDENIILINNAEYWEVERKAGASDIMLTLEWDERTTQREIFVGDLNDDVITIVRWNEEKNIWEDQMAIADVVSKTLSAPVKGYGVFTIARKQSSSLKLDIYNAVIINDNEDYFIIGLLENFDNNTVEIYNRWGVKVFETKNYGDTKDNVFKGYSKGRVTMQQGEKLPAGTYYYIISCEYRGSNNQQQTFKKAGYLHLEHN